MSFALIRSRAQTGTEAPDVRVEVFLSGGLPGFSIVGMAETAVKESRDRVRGAIVSAGFRLPQQRITVSLAPADMKKTGSRFDLAIAIGILVASRQLPELPDRTEFYGELSLNGRLRHVPGLLPAAIAARNEELSMLVPRRSAAEAALAGAVVYGASSLLAVTAHLTGAEPIEPASPPDLRSNGCCADDLSDVQGQETAKRALEIAAAGGHNLLFIGPPGTGKTMLAKRLPGLLPPMSKQEALQTAAVHSVLGERLDVDRLFRRPFRSPHHTVSAIALVGGGGSPRPGEISRAHNGVLFLDELPEFNRHTLEVLREPIEAGEVCISRAAYQLRFPSRFQLVAAMNPCPCGELGDVNGRCGCSRDRVRAYRSRLSGPLLDRIDLQVDVARQCLASIRRGAGNNESSATVAERVADARDVALKRQGCVNANVSGEMLEQLAQVQPGGWALLERAATQFRLSTRAAYRVLRVSRTIADLSADHQVTERHVAEALSLRQLDRET
ncbi:MAG: YifB family Mg chelatase-like AAA ATPase [Woeseiaceae bacterium]|nr:YifB family Mg chelatase-like AAA ATPase [Woeseiaceae bacterium]